MFMKGTKRYSGKLLLIEVLGNWQVNLTFVFSGTILTDVFLENISLVGIPPLTNFKEGKENYFLLCVMSR